MDARLSASGLTRGQRLAARSILAALALGVVLLLVTDGDRRPLGPEVLAGVDELRVQLADDPAPSFDLAGTEGIRHRLGDFAGRPLLIHFWASWCPPCRKELPDFAAFHRENREKGVAVVGIAVDEAVPAIKKLVAESGVGYPVVLGDRKLQADYGGIRAVPTTFVIDKAGTIVKKHLGMMSKADLEAAVKAIK